MTELMAQRYLRQKARISYYEPEEPALDEYVFCETCGDYVYEYCSIHGPLLVIPDDKVPAKPNVPSYVPRAALTIPHVFLHITYSIIPDAGLGVFSSMTLPSGVRFGPYRGQRTDVVDSSYCWQIYDKNRKPVHCIDAADANKSNWMRYVNCARHWKEQNLVAYQYRGELYYRTIKIIPRFTELMVFYGSEFACELDVDLGKYNSPPGYAQKFGAPVAKKRKSSENSVKTHEGTKTLDATQKTAISEGTNNHNSGQGAILTDITDETFLGQVTLPTASEQKESTNDRNKKNTKLKLDIVEKKRKGNVNKKYTSTAKHSSATKNVKSMAEIEKGQANMELQEIRSSKKKEAKARIETNACVKDLYIYCDECNKRCVTKLELQKHLRFHDINRTYVCEICKKNFTINGHLKLHMRTHTGEKPYVCEICKKACTKNDDLKKHMRTHTGEKPYACEICEKAFTQNSNLETHMRTHTGEKPYVCEICKKACTKNDDLKKHMRTHTGEKPYACEICNTKFCYKYMLKTHLIKKHLR